MGKRSKISIIVPCFNQAHYLSDALSSVLSQTYPEWECIIVNDGSPDNTEDIAFQWIDRDNRFKYLKKENGGLSSARNAGIAATTGEFILPLDADDKIGADYLKEAVHVLREDKEVRIVYGEAEFFGDRNGKWDLPEYTLRKMALSNLIYCSAVFRRSDFNKAGPYDESLKKGLEDWDLWLSILKTGGKVIRLPDPYFYYRKVNSGSMVDEMQNAETLDNALKYIYLKHSSFYFELFGNPIKILEEREGLIRDITFYKSGLERLKESKSYKIGSFLKRNFGM